MTRLADFVGIGRRYMRSVNLERDSDLASSLDGYLLTPQGLEVLWRILDAYQAVGVSRAWTLTGVYGTGKSAFANFAAALLAPEDHPARVRALQLLRQQHGKSTSEKAKRAVPSDGLVRAVVMARREPISHTVIRALARGVEQFWAGRRGRKPKVLGRTLELHERLQSGNAIDASVLPDLVSEIAEASGTGVVLVIDELGKLLEHSALSSGADDLFLLQQLAELRADEKRPPVMVLGLLHQAFSEYGHLLSAAERAEWEKVQGRFEDVPFTESAAQMLRLMADAIESSPPPSIQKAIQKRALQWHKRISHDVAEPYIRDLVDKERISDLYPLHPMTAVVMPVLCTRYGQNDRSLFTFLGSNEVHGLSRFLEEQRATAKELPVLGVDQVYDYFIDSARVGASNRIHLNRWAEIHGLIRDATGIDSTELKALKVIGTFNLVSSSGPLRASRELILAALAENPGDEDETARWIAVIDGLVERRVVAYRHQVDEYRLWQGTDLDIDARLEARVEAERRPLAEILTEVAPASPVVVQRHSYQSGTLRYFERTYVEKNDALKTAAPRIEGADGLLVYWVGENPPDFVPEATVEGKPLAVVPVDRSRTLASAARELAGLASLSKNDIALQTDGVARREVHERLSLARQVLDEALRETFDDWAARKCWLNGKELRVGNLNAALSDLCDHAYSGGPILWNEIINRRDLTSQGARAQREVLAALLTNPHVERLGIDGTGPDYSIYSSLLQNTGIHRVEDGEWVITRPNTTALIPLWDAIEEFCVSAKDQIRPIADLYEILQAPPYGVRAGVIPIFLAAVLLYHADDVSVYQDGSFLPAVGPAHFELLVKRPERFAVKYFELSGIRWDVFRELESVLRAGGAQRPRSGRNATMLTVVRPLVRFATLLPPVTKAAEDLSPEAVRVRDALLTVGEPDRLIFEALPVALGQAAFTGEEGGTRRHEVFRHALFDTLRELQMYYERLLDRCRNLIHDAFGVRTDVEHLREDLRVRASYLEGKVIEHRLKSFIVAAVDDEASDREWMESLVMIIADRPAETWTKDDLLAFEMNVSEFGRRFANLEALQHEAARTGIEGFQARRVTITEPGGEELHRLVWVDNQSRDAIDAQVERIVRDIRRFAEEHQQHAVLVAVLERMLQRPHSPTPAATDQQEERRHA